MSIDSPTIRPAARAWRPVLLATCSLLCTYLLPSQAAGYDSGPSVELLLRRAIRAERSINLRGEQLVFNFAPQARMNPATRHVVWRSDGRSLSIHREPGASGATVKVDDGKWTTCYAPGAPVAMVTHSPPRARDEHSTARLARLILHNYQATLRGKEKMAGRTCYVLELIPRHPMSRAVKLWLDERTGVVLSRQENDRQGSTLSLMLFKEVHYPRYIEDSELRYSPKPKRKVVNISRSPLYHDLGSLRRAAKFEFCQPVCMPAGYEFEACELVHMDGAPVVCLRYTDGLANITICENRGSVPRPDGRSAIRWQLLSRGEAMVAFSYGPMDITVMGNAEVPGLIDIARSMDEDEERVGVQYLRRTFKINSAQLGSLRDQGMGLDAIAALLIIAAHKHLPLTRLLARYRDGWSWFSIAQQLNDDGNQVASRIELMLKPAKYRN